MTERKNKLVEEITAWRDKRTALKTAPQAGAAPAASKATKAATPAPKKSAAPKKADPAKKAKSAPKKPSA